MYFQVNIAAARQKEDYGSESKYWKICTQLPDRFSENDGYHSTCYSRFTSISKAAPNEPSSEQPKHNVILRSQTKQHPTTSTGVLLQICIFCSKSHKKGRELSCQLRI